MIQKTLDGKNTIQTNLPDNEFADVRCDYDVQQVKAKEFFEQHENQGEAEGYMRLPGPCESTHLQPVQPIDYSKEPDCIRYFKCWRCKRKVDRAKENMWRWAPTQVLGLAIPLHSYCWDCYLKVKRKSKGRLAGLTGREFACVATERINDRINGGR